MHVVRVKSGYPTISRVRVWLLSSLGQSRLQKSCSHAVKLLFLLCRPLNHLGQGFHRNHVGCELCQTLGPFPVYTSTSYLARSIG